MSDVRLIVVASAIGALGIAGEWAMAGGLVAAPLIVGAVVKRRGDKWSRALTLAALTAVVTMLMWAPALLVVALVLAPFDSSATDPWHDYLALPAGPLVLIVQGLGLFVANRRLRWALLGGGAAAITLMFVYVATLDLGPDEGANIGAGVLFLWLLVSLALVAAGLGREVFRRSASRESAR